MYVFTYIIVMTDFLLVLESQDVLNIWQFMAIYRDDDHLCPIQRLEKMADIFSSTKQVCAGHSNRCIPGKMVLKHSDTFNSRRIIGSRTVQWIIEKMQRE